MAIPTSPKVDFPIWEARWKALEASIVSYQTRLSPYTKDNAIQAALHNMLKHLQTFADTQFHFFYNGFAPTYNYQRVCSPLPENIEYRLASSDEYPPDYVLGVTLKQIAYDLEVIQRVAEQRIWASQTENDRINKTLTIADGVAKVTLEKVYNSKQTTITGKPPTVITYLEKSPSVRCFPYPITTDTGVALIAIPFTCVFHSDAPTPENIQDYVPILHELGHCVFWYGQIKGAGDTLIPIHKTLSQSLAEMKEKTPWCFRWIEEIFADVFGCIIGGPVIALSAQDLAMVASEKEFTKNDGEHPIPAIRPIIYTNVLQKLNNGVPNGLTTKLEEHWKTRQKERLQHEPEKGEFTVFEEQSTQDSWQCIVQRVGFADAMREINTVITEIIKQVFNNDSSLKQIFNGFWGNEVSSTLISDDTLENLYTLFQNRINRLVESTSQPTPSQPTPLTDRDKTVSFSAPTKRTWEDWVCINDYLDKPLSEYKTADEIPAIDGSERTKGRTGWLNVLYAGGWATKGPTTNPSVK